MYQKRINPFICWDTQPRDTE